jgi:hypothetical protein
MHGYIEEKLFFCVCNYFLEINRNSRELFYTLENSKIKRMYVPHIYKHLKCTCVQISLLTFTTDCLLNLLCLLFVYMYLEFVTVHLYFGKFLTTG